ncbi:MAG: hypothetical protein NZ853_00970 [Leptospiraceae bacterium]|nr:hypothetical protein [Leptospiraceae bacterium]MDW7976199.1 hypothetical protein [Leptospiraceae bacterium]
MRKNSKLLFLIILLLTTFQLKSQNPSSNPAISLFERAYDLEKENPNQSIEYYNQAIQMGLPQDLKRTAMWRLYFIYLEKKQFIKAWQILSQIPNRSSAEKKFFEEMNYYAKINKDEFLQLYNAIKQNSLKDVKRLFKTINPILKQEILDFYSDTNEDLLEELVNDQFPNNPIDTKLFLANYFIEKNKLSKAENLLLEVSTDYQNELSPTYKEKILYLLGKIKRERNMLDAIPYFLTAANYSPTVRDYEKQLALAMYSLYRSGYEEVAYNLEEYIHHLPNEPMQKLFILLIKAEKEPSQKNLQELKKQTLQISENSFLKERAQKLLSRYESY